MRGMKGSYLFAILLMALAATVVAACGPDEVPAVTTPGTMDGMMDETATPGDMDGMMDETVTPGGMGDMEQEMAGAIEFDQAFIDMMVPHHEGATEMARIAQERAEHPEIREMANAIVAAQEPEIALMREWRQQWYGSSDTPSMSEMPMVGGMAGMADPETMDMAAEVEALRNAPEPFDLAFIDAMIAHHESAIEAARLGLEQSTRPEVTDLAQAIIEGQQREIDQLRAWREAWY